jgi:hypothetical protein
MQAYRAIQTNTKEHKSNSETSFQLVAPYLTKFEEDNPDSKIVCENDANNCNTYCFIFPGIMKRAMRFVRPVVGLD